MLAFQSLARRALLRPCCEVACRHDSRSTSPPSNVIRYDTPFGDTDVRFETFRCSHAPEYVDIQLALVRVSL